MGVEPRIRVSAILRREGRILLCSHEKGGKQYWLLAEALAHRTGGEVAEFDPLADALEAEAHAVSASRARSRGGRYA